MVTQLTPHTPHTSHTPLSHDRQKDPVKSQLGYFARSAPRGSLAQPVVRRAEVRFTLVCHPLRSDRLLGGCPFYIWVACKLRSRCALDGCAFAVSWVLRSLVFHV